MPPRRDENHQYLYDFKTFDLSTRRPNRLTVILGKRDSGKTMWMLYLAMQSEWRDDGMVLVIARTEKSRAIWRKIAPHAAIYPPSRSILRKIQEKQEENIAKFEAEGKPFPREYHLSVYIDDCGYDKDFMRCREMVELVSNSRQWNIDVTISFQHFNNFVPDGRENADEIFVLASGDEGLILDLRKHFVSCVKNDIFIRIVNTLTQHHGACVIRNKGGIKVEDICFALHIPTDLLMEVEGDDGQPTVVFRDLIKIGNPWQHKFIEERTVKNQKDKDKDKELSTKDKLEDVYEEDLELEEDNYCSQPQILLNTTDRFGRLIQIRCIDPKIKRD